MPRRMLVGSLPGSAGTPESVYSQDSVYEADEVIPRNDMIQPPAQSWSGLRNHVSVTVRGVDRTHGRKPRMLRGRLYIPGVPGTVGGDTFQSESFSMAVNTTREFDVDIGGSGLVHVEFENVGVVSFSATQAGKLETQLTSDATDMASPTKVLARQLTVVVVGNGPEPARGPESEPSVAQNMVAARSALEVLYRQRIVQHMDSDYVDRENEPVPCFDVKFGGATMPTASYFSGIFAKVADPDALLFPIFRYACFVEGIFAANFVKARMYQRADVLARVCTLLSTTMHYSVDTTESIDDNGDFFDDPCNLYNTFLSWRGDCEEMTLLALHVFRWILLTRSAKMGPLREFASNYTPTAAFTRIRSTSPRAHHVHGLLLLKDLALLDDNYPPVILLEGTTRTEGLLVKPQRMPALPTNAQGERRAVVMPDGSVNNWYLDVVCLYDAQAFGIGELDCTPRFPVASADSEQIGVPLSTFMETPYLRTGPLVYAPATRQYAYFRALPVCPRIDLAAVAPQFSPPAMKRRTRMRTLEDGENAPSALLIVTTPLGRVAFE